MIERLAYMWPEIALFVTTCVVMVIGLSKSRPIRKMSAPIAGAGLVAALVLSLTTTPYGSAVRETVAQTLLPDMPRFAKAMVAGVGLLLLLLAAGTVDREDEDRIAADGRAFDPMRSNRAEFYAFFLFSITGLMLTATASDLVWLFLALELTSLPTYIMVAISSPDSRSKEASVKYFFLGALGAATFLFGFALLYGGTGSTKLNVIASTIAGTGLGGLTMAGLVLSVLGMAFKIAAVPMHFYTADVYQGSSASVGGFLAFVPKTAGFLGLMLLLATAGWNHDQGLPESVRTLLWILAVTTMTVGNVLALLQRSVKRVLAYSSVAHSGYMLVGLIAGPGSGANADNGLAAVLFYLVGYGVTSTGTFAVLASLERRNADGTATDADSFADLKGLCRTSPMLGWTMVVCSLSLLGFPPLLGFFGKLPLFTSGVSAHEVTLVVILGLNSAVAALYYLRFTQACLLEDPEAMESPALPTGVASRPLAGVLAAGGVVVLAVFGGTLLKESQVAGSSPRLTKEMLHKHVKPAMRDASVEKTPH